MCSAVFGLLAGQISASLEQPSEWMDKFCDLRWNRKVALVVLSHFIQNHRLSELGVEDDL